MRTFFIPGASLIFLHSVSQCAGFAWSMRCGLGANVPTFKTLSVGQSLKRYSTHIKVSPNTKVYIFQSTEKQIYWFWYSVTFTSLSNIQLTEKKDPKATLKPVLEPPIPPKRQIHMLKDQVQSIRSVLEICMRSLVSKCPPIATLNQLHDNLPLLKPSSLVIIPSLLKAAGWQS